MIDPASLATASAAAIARAYASGDTDPVAVTEHFLERIAAQASPVFIRVTADRALKEARAAAGRYASGYPLSPLDGVPIAWKDLIDMAGETTTAASDLYRDAPAADADAPVVAKATAAGMVSLGKLNLSEFAYSGLGLNPHFGTPVNPNDPVTPRVPGGSSSASGVAVAAGLVPIAIGSDTGGSIRIPASFNGVVGSRSSLGRIDTTGVFALSRTLDTLGPLARTVEDCILADMALRGAVSSAVRRAPVKGLRIFVPETIVLDELEPAVAANFEASLRALEAAGAVITRGPLEVFAEAERLGREHGTIAAAEGYVEHQAQVDNSEEAARIDRRVVHRLLGGKAMSAADIISLERGRRKGMADIAVALDGALCAMPTTPHVAPAIAPLEADDKLFHKINLKGLRNTVIGSYLNMPGIAIPNGRDAAGMPTSFLLSAAGGEDERLLGAALGVERCISSTFAQA